MQKCPEASQLLGDLNPRIRLANCTFGLAFYNTDHGLEFYPRPLRAKRKKKTNGKKLIGLGRYQVRRLFPMGTSKRCN